MTLIVDAAPLLVAADEREPLRDAVWEVLRSEPQTIVVPAPVTAEVDYLLRTRLGRSAAKAFLTDVAEGRFEVVGLSVDDHRLALEIDGRYADLGLGLADLSVIVLAHRFGTHRLLTFDQRHFRAVTALDGQPFTLLPADAELLRTLYCAGGDEQARLGRDATCELRGP